jgi:hypothetical protein
VSTSAGDEDPAKYRRLLAATVVVAVAFVAFLVAVALSASGGNGPDTGAASIVPADALAFVNVSTDRSRPEVKRALALARGFPGYPAARAAVLRGLTASVSGTRRGQFTGALPRWVGGEAAIALLNTATSTAGSLIALAVSDRAGAAAFLQRSGASPRGRYRGTALLGYAGGTELAFVGRFLVLGQDPSVRAAIDVGAGSSPSLASSDAYGRVASGEPADRVLDAYASVAGVRRILSDRGGVLGALGRLVDQPALEGVTLSVSPRPSGADVVVHSALDPTLVRVSGARPRPFTPSLARELPSGATLMLDVADLSAAAPRVLGAGAAAGFAGGLAPLLGRLGTALGSEGVDIKGVLSAILGGESAVAIVSRASAPTVVVISRARNEAATRSQLAALELPLSQLFPAPNAGPGGTATFNDVQVAGVTAHQLALNPGLQLDYAVFRHLVVISTSLQGIAAVAEHHGSLASDPAYRAELGTSPRSVTSLLFLDFSQLLNLGEQTGLTGRGRIRALLPDLQKIRAIGLSSTSGEAASTSELSLRIS